MAEDIQGEEVGRVVDYFARIGVAGIDMTGSLKVGDKVRVRGHTSDLELVVESIQVEHAQVEEVKAGDKIGIKVGERCRRGDRVYRLSDG
jgi:selenocysteine-specific translation elongation factor